MAKKNNAKQERLDARAAQIRAQVEAERRRTYIIITVFAFLIVGGAGGLYMFTANPFNFGGGNTAGAGKAVGAAYAVPDEGHDHPTRPAPVTYKHQPPSSGNHYNDSGAPRPWGNNQTALLAEEYIHNLEHGGVVMVYKCSGSECDDFYAQSQALSGQLPKDSTYGEVKFLTTPYQAMTPKFALLAWDHEQDFSGFPPTSDVTAFYNRFVNQGPEKKP
ncbi:MAG: DUF3105 domain-containing protein [Candidatus Dormibacteraeota bacterium]|nr:DUF3105 domain-containing protein [Candidatus Dormibacteraeota bacterium]